MVILWKNILKSFCGTAQGLLERFGPERVIDTPVSENAMTGAAVGAAIAGMKPIVVRPRTDFMLYAIDPIINEAANWHYMNGAKPRCRWLSGGIINRGGEQGAQHSQAIQAMNVKNNSPTLFTHFRSRLFWVNSCSNPVHFLPISV